MKSPFYGHTLLMISTVVGSSICHQAAAQTRIYETNVLVETIAGSGFSGHVDGVGVMTMFNRPTGLAVDPMTNVFVWDDGNRCIRKISPDGTVTTFAGSGRQAHEDGVGTNASFVVEFPYEADLVAGTDGSIYFANLGSIRKITQAAVVTTYAREAIFGGSLGLAIDAQDNIYVADESNCRIRKISMSGIVTTIAGSGNIETVDGAGIFSSFCYPHGIAVDPVGNVYVGERCGAVIRRISTDGSVRTFAGHLGENGIIDGMGTNATLRGILRLACDSLGNIYTAEDNFIRKITPEARVTTLAGGANGLFAEGEGQAARFNQARAIAIDPAGRLWIADTGNHRIRRISFSAVPTTGVGLSMYAGLSVTGVLGRSYRIEFTDSLRATNDWVTAATVSLSNSPTLWFDTESPIHPKRFYRAVLVP